MLSIFVWAVIIGLLITNVILSNGGAMLPHFLYQKFQKKNCRNNFTKKDN